MFVGGFWCGLDAGFFPWDYLPYYTDDYYPYDYYTADVPQYNTENTEAIDNGYRWLTRRSKPCRRSSLNWAFTAAQPMAFSVRLPATPSRNIKSLGTSM